MPTIHHDEHLLDRAAMVATRAVLAVSPALAVSPEGRTAYDEMIARTPMRDGVAWSEGRIGGVAGWIGTPTGATAGRAVLYLHGGAYVLGSAEAYRGVASQVAARVGAAVFVADYRLAPEHPFPAAFDDAAAALDGLAAAGFDEVAVVGDSAGGGLALALLASGLATTRAVAAATFSPWIDLSLTNETLTSRADADPFLSRDVLRRGAESYLGDRDPADPRVNALTGDLAKLPPVRIDVGDDEVLLGDALRLGAAAEAAGRPCEVHVWKGMTHVFPASVTMLKAASEALDGVAAFLREAFGHGASR